MCTRLQISPIRAAVVASRNIARCVLKPHRQPETRRGPSNLPGCVARARECEPSNSHASRNEAAGSIRTRRRTCATRSVPALGTQPLGLVQLRANT
jgi:hypothetical protein